MRPARKLLLRLRRPQAVDVRLALRSMGERPDAEDLSGLEAAGEASDGGSGSGWSLPRLRDLGNRADG